MCLVVPASRSTEHAIWRHSNMVVTQNLSCLWQTNKQVANNNINVAVW